MFILWRKHEFLYISKTGGGCFKNIKSHAQINHYGVILVTSHVTRRVKFLFPNDVIFGTVRNLLTRRTIFPIEAWCLNVVVIGYRDIIMITWPTFCGFLATYNCYTLRGFSGLLMLWWASFEKQHNFTGRNLLPKKQLNIQKERKKIKKTRKLSYLSNLPHKHKVQYTAYLQFYICSVPCMTFCTHNVWAGVMLRRFPEVHLKKVRGHLQILSTPIQYDKRGFVLLLDRSKRRPGIWPFLSVALELLMVDFQPLFFLV